MLSYVSICFSNESSNFPKVVMFAVGFFTVTLKAVSNALFYLCFYEQVMKMTLQKNSFAPHLLETTFNSNQFIEHLSSRSWVFEWEFFIVL